MGDDFEALKVVYELKPVSNWNIEDSGDYQEQLKVEIVRIEEILATKQDISARAEALFKPRRFCF